MLLGKRSRPSSIMRRTTSMSEGISNNLDSNHEEVVVITPDSNIIDPPPQDSAFVGLVMSPTTSKTHPQNKTTLNHVMQIPHFLTTCCLCKTHLTPGRDIYMYRGDTAFCSLECREHQIRQDHRKWKMASKKEDHRAPPPAATAANNSETAACN
ncbi:hypothetical protein TanjilG_16752 [Lupinus angustifolius]|uniref:FLZ-type domain-containing protein n=1 Tax=Lupinus angustifolius TaxID=3871 RepID=A0A4P1QZX6_LUPAN|nr:PREDICTED: uncharacterized protein LOC109326167 [Lupinus angustifolius]XP_019414392.1 PREDICTED: uncharacterized protein LOC109326167 [Lupinus angustifolius]XP_019414393.1 PREDICTED: uncharacterized protein LOC109326167 [Lupinus angustifolius]OIV98425.1 hypothetical protein TanjilG_16752 [Lupinus angustifolius]